MNSLLLGIIHDLRRRRLLPVAILLVVVAVALPVVALKPAEDPGVTPAPSAVNATQSANGLPSPEQALNGSDRPLVTLAVLREASDLSEFESKNPFKPIDQVQAQASDGQQGGGSSDLTVPASGSGSGSSGGSGGSGGSSAGDSGSTGGGTATTPTTTAPTTTPDTNEAPTTEKNEQAKKLTYALDLSFRTPGSDRTYRSVAKLRMLPSQSSPLFIYLGVDQTGTKAVFLVDSTLTVTSGEGTCKPSNQSCATVEIGPGEVSRFRDAEGKEYELEVEQLRLVSAKKSAAAAAKAAKASAKRGTAGASVAPKRRFVPPVITDLFVGAGR